MILSDLTEQEVGITTASISGGPFHCVVTLMPHAPCYAHLCLWQRIIDVTIACIDISTRSAS